MTNNSLKIGFVGLGSMGMGSAVSLVKAGFAVRGFDVRAEVLKMFNAAGGAGVPTAADAARGADVYILMVVNAQQADDVLFGSGDAAAVLPKGAIVMLCSTVSPQYARETAVRLEEMGLNMLDSPISGGPVRAAAGELSIMLSGKPALIERVQPLLDAMSSNVFRMGDECGLGSTMKLVNQVLAGVNLAVATEAIAFGARAGIEPQRIFEVISVSAGSSWMFQNRVPHILEDDYTPMSAVDIWVKDLGLVLDTGKENRLPLPMAAAAHQLFMMASASGWGKLDDAAAVKVYEKLANFRVLGGGVEE